MVRTLRAVFCGGQIIASENNAVCWTTPLGLPVVQPYRKPGRHLVMLLTSLINDGAKMIS